jgi:hypothetical protein
VPSTSRGFIEEYIVPALKVREVVCKEASKYLSSVTDGITYVHYLALEHLLHSNRLSGTRVTPSNIIELLKCLSGHPQPGHVRGTVLGYAYGLKHVLDKVPDARRILVAAYSDYDPHVAFPALLLSIDVFGPEAEPLLEAGFYPAVVGALSHRSPFCRMAAALAAYDASRKPAGISGTTIEKLRGARLVPALMRCVNVGLPALQQGMPEEPCRDWSVLWQCYKVVYRLECEKGGADILIHNLNEGLPTVTCSILSIFVRVHSICAKDVAAFDNSANILVQALSHRGVHPKAVARLLAEVTKSLPGPECNKFVESLIFADFPRVVSELLDSSFPNHGQALALIDAMGACRAFPLRSHQALSPIISALLRYIVRSPRTLCAGRATEVMFDILDRFKPKEVGDVLQGLDFDEKEYAATVGSLVQELSKENIRHRLKAIPVIARVLGCAQKLTGQAVVLESDANWNFFKAMLDLIRIGREPDGDPDVRARLHNLWSGLYIFLTYAAPDTGSVERALAYGLKDEIESAKGDNHRFIQGLNLHVATRVLAYRGARDHMREIGLSPEGIVGLAIEKGPGHVVDVAQAFLEISSNCTADELPELLTQEVLSQLRSEMVRMCPSSKKSGLQKVLSELETRMNR